eukprot:636825-Prymnesium_polylepis.1
MSLQGSAPVLPESVCTRRREPASTLPYLRYAPVATGKVRPTASRERDVRAVLSHTTHRVVWGLRAPNMRLLVSAREPTRSLAGHRLEYSSMRAEHQHQHAKRLESVAGGSALRRVHEGGVRASAATPTPRRHLRLWKGSVMSAFVSTAAPSQPARTAAIARSIDSSSNQRPLAANLDFAG